MLQTISIQWCECNWYFLKVAIAVKSVSCFLIAITSLLQIPTYCASSFVKLRSSASRTASARSRRSLLKTLCNCLEWTPVEPHIPDSKCAVATVSLWPELLDESVTTNEAHCCLEPTSCQCLGEARCSSSGQAAWIRISFAEIWVGFAEDACRTCGWFGWQGLSHPFIPKDDSWNSSNAVVRLETSGFR